MRYILVLILIVMIIRCMPPPLEDGCYNSAQITEFKVHSPSEYEAVYDYKVAIQRHYKVV